MLEGALQTDDVLLVFGIGLVEFIEDLDLLLAGLHPMLRVRPCAVPVEVRDSHRLLVAGNLNCHFPPSLSALALENTSTDHIRKHALSEYGEDLIPAAIQLLSQNDLVIPLGVGSCVEICGDEGRSGGFLCELREYMRSMNERKTIPRSSS